MADIRITCNVPNDMVEAGNHTGLTQEGYDEVMDALLAFGATEIDIRRSL